MRVLLVEDERKVASFIARALRENTHAVDIAESGEKALELSSDLFEILEEACALVAPRARAKNISIVRHLHQEVASVGDEEFLHELFLIFLKQCH
jgi:CheY-like chemotaxis protein